MLVYEVCIPEMWEDQIPCLVLDCRLVAYQQTPQLKWYIIVLVLFGEEEICCPVMIAVLVVFLSLFAPFVEVVSLIV